MDPTLVKHGALFLGSCALSLLLTTDCCPPVLAVAILTGSQVILNLGMGFMVPVLPLFARDMAESSGYHLGATGVGLIIAAPSITRRKSTPRPPPQLDFQADT